MEQDPAVSIEMRVSNDVPVLSNGDASRHVLPSTSFPHSAVRINNG